MVDRPSLFSILYPGFGTLNTNPISMKKEKSKQLDDSMSDSLNLAYDPVSLLEIFLTYLIGFDSFSS